MRNAIFMFLLLMSFTAYAQVGVKGKVLDETGLPMIGVTITIEGSQTGTITDIDGNYSIEAPSPESRLVFTYVGYLSETITVGNQTVIDVNMLPDLISLGEVIVIGYGTTKKADLTSAISTVKSEEIAKVPVTSFSQALQGKAAGVTVLQSGAPGGAASVRIRGTSSINGATPLYVVDGVIGAPEPNSNDIESIQILKDAASCAIYGSRGTNGVIIVTTKKGKKGEPKVALKSYYGFQNVTNTLDMLSGQQFIDYWESNLATDNLTDEFGNKLYPNGANITRPKRVDSALVNPGTYYYDTDWQDEIYRQGSVSNINFAISGGNDKASYFTSFDHKNNDGVQIGSGFKSSSLQLNSDYSKGIFTVGENVNLRFNKSLDNGSRLRYALRQSPLLPVYNPQSASEIDKYAGNTELDNSNNPNPVGSIYSGSSESTQEVISGGVFGEVKILESLKFRTNYNLIYSTGIGINKSYKHIEGTAGPQVNTTSMSQSGYRTLKSQFENVLTFKKSIVDHNITLMAGYTMEEEISRGYSGSADNFLVSDPVSLGSRLEESGKNVSGNYYEVALQSGLGRLMYDYKSRYLFTANIRADGSSVFQDGHRWSYFPSVSVGWNVHHEAFMRNMEFINNLKLRGSYGKIGSQILPGGSVYNNPTLLSSATYIINNQVATGVTNTSVIDATLTWEETLSTNIGVDLELFKGAFSFTADYFWKENQGMLLAVRLPYSSGLGYSSYVNKNVGSLMNKGLELSMAAHKSAGQFTFDVIGNFTYEQTEITSLGLNKDFTGGVTQYYRDGLTRTEVGTGLGDFYGYVTDGIYQIGDKDIPANKQPGDIRYKDLNSDGRITADDRTYLGSAVPDFTYSLTINTFYKGFDLSLFFQGVYGNKIFNHNRYHTETLAKSFNQSVDVLDAWTPENPSNTMPRYTDQHTDNYALPSDRFLEDGSYLRFQNITLGYTLPAAWVNLVKVTSLRVYGSVQNVATLTKYSGMDPEIYASGGNTLGRGIDDAQYPLSQTVVFGIELNF